MEMNNSPWPGRPGVIPVTSGNAEDANRYNRNYLDRIHVEMRVIDSTEVSLEKEIFGKKYDSPIMMPAFSHLNKVLENGRTPMEEYAVAAKKLHSSVAVGIDIDHVPGTDGLYDVVDGFPMGPVFSKDLADFVSYAKLPFVAKGVLSVQDAIKAKEAGCAAIVVSHHHGRLPFGIAPLQILPKIKEALKDTKMQIFVDCSMDTGYDAYKALALGADAVSVGRGILQPLLSHGAQGVIAKVENMQEELREMMMYTGVKDCDSFDASVLYLC